MTRQTLTIRVYIGLLGVGTLALRVENSTPTLSEMNTSYQLFVKISCWHHSKMLSPSLDENVLDWITPFSQCVPPAPSYCKDPHPVFFIRCQDSCSLSYEITKRKIVF